MNFIKNFMRISCWWHYKAAPLMAFIYAKAFTNSISPWELMPVAAIFFVALVGIAGLGHFINDIADINEDKLSGKENFAAQLSLKQKILAGAFLLTLCVLPWVFIKTDSLILLLLTLQIVFYALYSLKPFRFKNRHFWGILADAFYGHINPALVVLAVFSYYGAFQQAFTLNNLFAIALIIWLFCKGVRNIMLHQIDDRKKDLLSGVKTFVVKFGGVRTLNIINSLILPLEFLVFALLIYFACNSFRDIYIPFMAFLMFTFIKFSLWKIFVLPPRQMRFKFLFFLNDFYEDWLPVIMLAYLIKADVYFVFYLILHLAFFPKTIINTVKDLKLLYVRKLM